MKKTSRLIYLFLITCSFSVTISQAQEKVSEVTCDPLVEELLMLKSKMSKENELSDRYKIQLYYGDLKEANKIKKDFEEKYDKWPSSLEYESPNYKIWVGDFRNRLEAERAYVDLKKDFKSAFIFRPKG